MLIFLDIDGVMVPLKGWRTVENLEDSFPDFTKESIMAIKRFTPDEIVLISSHRFRFTPDVWKNIFERRNIFVNKFSILPDEPKLEAIIKWIDDNQCDDYMIFDDDTRLNALPEKYKEFLIVPSSLIGLI